VSGYKHEDINLAKLIKKISSIQELKRIRFTTSHPNDFDEELINIFRDEEKLMPQLHLPVQSGSNKILALMNRNHTREFYLELLEKFRNVRKDIEFSSDFIIGYPGETDKDFEETLSLVDTVKFSNSYSFIYSQRPGTPAVDYQQIPKEIAQSRLEVLQNKLIDLQIKFNESKINTKTKVLLENITKKGDQFFGRNEHMQAVFVEGTNYIPGTMTDVMVQSCNRNNLFGATNNN
jgi:tRNA-2-methylthio-N6-dimethylallyladenosine synthase